MDIQGVDSVAFSAWIEVFGLKGWDWHSGQDNGFLGIAEVLGLEFSCFSACRGSYRIRTKHAQNIWKYSGRLADNIDGQQK
jgi:hypothetical protein